MQINMAWREKCQKCSWPRPASAAPKPVPKPSSSAAAAARPGRRGFADHLSRMHNPSICKRYQLTCPKCLTGEYAVRHDGGGGTGGDIDLTVEYIAATLPPGSAPPLVLRDATGYTANDWRLWHRGEWQDPASGSGDRAAAPQPAPGAAHAGVFQHAPKRRANKKRGGNSLNLHAAESRGSQQRLQ